MSVEDQSDATLTRCDQDRIIEAAQAIAANRAVIEQAKGMLMFLYGIDADRAFDLLRWQSQEHNVKLRLLAEQILKDLVELSKSKPAAHRLQTDGLLLTAHQRVTHSAARQLDGESKTGVPMKDI
jgi:hypothetical protein